MDIEMLRELQPRGRFFYEMFPGAKAAQEWQRHRVHEAWAHKSRRDLSRCSCGGPAVRGRRRTR
jgi:hypothetical protein